MRALKGILFSRYGIVAIAAFAVGWLAMAAAMTWGVTNGFVQVGAGLVAVTALLVAAGSVVAGTMSVFGDTSR